MPNRIPTPGIKAPAVRTSKGAQSPAKQVINYAKNVAKEYGEWRKDENNNANVGQFYGALLQGRRYDSKGKQK